MIMIALYFSSHRVNKNMLLLSGLNNACLAVAESHCFLA